MTTGNTDDVIELRVDEIAQLFHTLDPFPFRERDLDREAEEFIVSWARELPTDQLIRIVVHFPDSDIQSKAAQELSEAFRRYFFHRAGVLQHDLSELFRVGRRSLSIGVFVLMVCFVAAHLAGGFLNETPFKRLVEKASYFWAGSPIGVLLKSFCTTGGPSHAGAICIAAFPRQSWKLGHTQ